MKYATPLLLDLRPSRQLAAGIVLVAMTALVAVSALALPWWSKILLGLLAGFYCLRIWRLHASRDAAQAVRQFVWRDAGDCGVVHADGRHDSGRLAMQAFVLSWAVVLRFRMRGKWHSLFILPDMLDPESMRRLRVRLRMQLQQNA